MQGAFWVLDNGELAYDSSGGVTTFDSTWGMTVHGYKFAPFCVVDANGATVPVAGAIVFDECVPTFQWVFNQFKQAGPNPCDVCSCWYTDFYYHIFSRMNAVSYLLSDCTHSLTT